MTGFVLDASAYVHAYTGTTAAADRMRSRMRADTAHAPHLIVAEVGSVARRMTASGAIRPDHGFALVDQVSAAVSQLYSHAPLVRLTWSLRHNLSFYDAIYVSLAAALGVPLVTVDARLGHAPTLPCAVEIIS